MSGTTADDDPGPGDVVDRIQASDGHFVNISATMLVVREPTTALLIGRALPGLAAFGSRIRK